MHVSFYYSNNRLLQNPKELDSSAKEHWMKDSLSSMQIDQQCTIESLYDRLSAHHPVICGSFEKYFRNSDFLGSCLFVLDMDTMTCSYEELMKRFSSLQFNPNISYETPSHTTSQPRYRFIFLMDAPIEKVQLFNSLSKQIAREFGGDLASWSCKMWQPPLSSNKITFHSDQPNSFLSPFMLEMFHTVENPQTGKEYSHTKKREHLRYIQKKSPSASVLSEDDAYKTIRNFDYPFLIHTSKVFKGFFYGELHLSYVQLRNLVTNLMHVSGGVKLIESKMKLLESTYNQSDWLLLKLPVWLGSRSSFYKPESMATFDPDIADKFDNILSVNFPDGGVKQWNCSPKINLENAEKQLYDNIDVWKYDPNNDLKMVIQSDYGTGKTRALIGLIKNIEPETKPYVICFASHYLMNEFACELDKQNIKYAKTPPSICFPHNKALQHKIENCYFLNEAAKLKKLYNQIQRPTAPYTEEDAAVVKKHLNALKVAKSANCVLLTTHHRAMLSNLSLHNTRRPIIFDEDIFLKQVPLISLSMNYAMDVLNRARDFKIVKRNMTSFYNDLEIVAQCYRGLTIGKIQSFTGTFAFNNYDALLFNLTQIEGSGRLIQLLRAHYICLWKNQATNDVFLYGITKLDPAHLGKRLVLSGSADEYILNAFDPEIKYMGSDRVENQGVVIQYTGNPYFKKQCRKGNVPNIPPGQAVITYKDLPNQENWKIDPNLHFFNALGTNVLAGKSISVVGTPILPTICTLLILKCLNFPTPITLDKVYRKVRLDEYEFKTFTFKDENLAQLECRFARMELEQACARARTIREDAVVSVHSTIPVRNADHFYYQPNSDKSRQFSWNSQSDESGNLEFTSK